MKKIELNFIESWAKVRESGRNIYALRTGVLWSVFTAFLTKILSSNSLYGSFKSLISNIKKSFVRPGVFVYWKYYFRIVQIL